VGNKTEVVQVLFHKRNARSRGGTSSNDQNDMSDEISHDLIEISAQINDSLVPLAAALPDGTVDTTVDAFTNGLDGKNLYTNAGATDVGDPDYFNVLAARPYTVYEQFDNVYDTVTGLRTDLEDQISGLLQSADMVTVADVGGLYLGNNVESCLTEVMEKVNLIALGQVDLAAVNQHYIPTTANTYDIGTSSVRMRSGYFGAALFLGQLSANPSTTTPGAMYYNTTISGLRYYNGSTWRTVSST
jgi:hypothetical protein